MNRKGCPLLLQSDTYPSLTMRGESHTRTYMLQCVGEKCVAYHGGFCKKWEYQTAQKERDGDD